MTSYTFQPIEPLPGVASYAYGLNDLGQIVGSYSVGSLSYAFVYSNGMYSTISYPDAYYTNVYGINNAGDIVGAYADSSPNHYMHGFLYSAGTYITLDSPFATYPMTAASGINDLGQIVGYYSLSPNYPFQSGFVYSQGVYTPVGIGAPTSLTAINNAGEFVGFYGSSFTGASYSFVGTANGLSELRLPYVDLAGRSPNNVAKGLNDAGEIVGSYNVFLDQHHLGPEHGFLYSGGEYVTIDHPLGTHGTALSDVNNLGQIVGYYYDASGAHAFLATPNTAPTNHAPVAIDIAARANEDSNNAAVVLTASFTDPDPSDTFVFTIDTSTTIGSVVDNHDGTFTYDPSGKFEFLGVGETVTDTFAYIVTDSHGANSKAMATVTVEGQNDAPAAVADAEVVQKGKTISINRSSGVLFNDSDPDNSHDSLSVVAVNGSAENVGSSVRGTFGVLRLNEDGSYIYSADRNIAALRKLRSVQDEFQYIVDDGHGGGTVSTLTVTVQNDAVLNRHSVVSISAADADNSEGDSGWTAFTFLVSRSGDLSQQTSVTWSVRAEESAPVADGLDFAGGRFPSGSFTFRANDPEPTLITVRVRGDYSRENGGLPENFVVTLDSASNGAIIDPARGSALGHIRDDDLLTSDQIFDSYQTGLTDGQTSFLAALAQAAYHLRAGEEVSPGTNNSDERAESAFLEIEQWIRPLESSDFPGATDLIPRSVDNPNFPSLGLSGGVYTNGNAAVLVTRSADALFLSFRGTNDNDGELLRVAVSTVGAGVAEGALPAIARFDAVSTPDMDHWVDLNRYLWPIPDEGMTDHYAQLLPLIGAVDAYVADARNHITHVYVTGHSLGASMAQQYMATHSGPRYEAVLFGSPGLEGLSDSNDARITNVRVHGDPVADFTGGDSPYGERGDIFLIRDQDGLGLTAHHDMELYRVATEFLSSGIFHDRLPNPLIDQFANRTQEQIAVTVDISRNDTWHIDLPAGSISGTSGIDVIVAGAGSDTLNGLEGNDVLSGGAGSDTFVFGRLTPLQSAGRDTIVDFHPGADQIHFVNLFSDFESMLNRTSDVNGDAVIRYNGSNALTLTGINRSDLVSEDFLFLSGTLPNWDWV